MRWLRRPRASLPVEPPAPAQGAPADLFVFLEASLEGLVLTPQLPQHAAAVSRTLELANDEWPERDAVRELLWLVAGDRRVLERLAEVFDGRLLLSMLPEPVGLRAGHLVDAALRQSYASGT